MNFPGPPDSRLVDQTWTDPVTGRTLRWDPTARRWASANGVFATTSLPTVTVRQDGEGKRRRRRGRRR